MQYLRIALDLLSPREKRQIISLLGLSSVAAVAQTVAILSIMPFIILLSNPTALQSNPTLIQLEQLMHADSPRQMLVWLGIIGVSTLAVGNLFVALENWLVHRYLRRLGHRIEKDLMQTILDRPYQYFTEHHSGLLSNIVIDQVDRMVDGVIGAFFGIVSNVILTAFIVLMLLLISFQTTLITLVGLVALYLGVFLFLRHRIADHGVELTRLAGDVHTAVKESLDGIREIKINRAEGFFARRFERSSLPLSQLAVRASVLEFLPNFVLETLVFAGLVGVGLYFVLVADYAGMSLSFIALYGMAIYRLVPALNGVFEGLSEIQHDGDAVRLVREHFYSPEQNALATNSKGVDRGIRLVEVSYKYPNSRKSQLSKISLDIPMGSSVCLFGESGAGKSTLLNVLAGLLRPQDGRVFYDDEIMNNASHQSWRGNIGFCPQQIYLFDGTIASNIAFGLEQNDVDLERVSKAGKLAMLEGWVHTDRAQGYAAMVGEGGIALSGGQRQRIGIARALYRDSDILMFDESLTGLDSANQRAILDNLFALSGKILILSTHDTAVARRCDNVILLQNGRIANSGRCEDVIGEQDGPDANDKD